MKDILQILEKPTLNEAFSNVINAGLYIIEPEVMEHIPKETKFDFSKELFPHLLKLGIPMYGVKLDGIGLMSEPQKNLSKLRIILSQTAKCYCLICLKVIR